MTAIDIGDSVQLAHGGVPGFGSLNSSFLWEEGYRGEPLKIEANAGYGNAGRYWRVTLPSGRRLDIHRGDVLSHTKGPKS